MSSSSSKDAALYGAPRPKRLKGSREISSSTTASFASQLGSLIQNAPASSSSRPAKKARSGKEDVFATHNRNAAVRAQRDLTGGGGNNAALAQTHTTHGEALDAEVWKRSRRRMQEKARLYAAMKRGDVEDEEGRFAVDFDRMWAERYGDLDEEDDGDDSEEEEGDGDGEEVEYEDEFGRTRRGTRAEAARAARVLRGQRDLAGDRFTARPTAPAGVIYGDTIQHQAFNPDEKVELQMEELAKKRDRSLTPPPDVHFDATREVRQKGTGFFQFSEDAEERKKQMEELERERLETEKVRRQKKDTGDRQEDRTAEQASQEQSKESSGKQGYKRKADAFFDDLAAKMAGETPPERSDPGTPAETMDAMQRIEAALAREAE